MELCAETLNPVDHGKSLLCDASSWSFPARGGFPSIARRIWVRENEREYDSSAHDLIGSTPTKTKA